MAPSLLCAEESVVCFDDAVDNELGNDELDQQIHRTHNQNCSFSTGGNFLDEFLLQSEEGLTLMFEKEHVHLPRGDYLKRLQNGELDSSIRRDAIDWIRTVHGIYNFGPLSAYLSINYLDRFLSVYELPRGKSWTMQLLAVACLSLGAKMEETKMPVSLDLQQVGEPKFIFEARTIQRMELLVLSTLKWRMQSVTPFSFIDYFLTKINDGQPPRLLISQSFELILSTIRGIDFLEFRPSEFAAAVAIHLSSRGLLTVELDKSASCFTQNLDKERVLKCIRMIQGEVPLINGTIKKDASSSHSSVPKSPNGVLDACLSYKSDESTDGSSANFSQTSHSKRRKLN
ncbi:Cyclin [Macleaya cordata]|uniref:Cyclin n=1 Tax=Macleaya cordata TaxID=56857 RepID=A0A200PNI5_MACCD|nr:Cyclin [Macleaya cordata]